MSANLILALEEVRRGSSLRAASAKFAISRSTLHDHYKGKHISVKRGPKSIFSEYEEKELVSLLLSASRKGFPLTPTDVRHAAFEYAEMCGYDNDFNKDTKLAGRQWLRNFLKRNPTLSIKKPEALSMSRAMGLNRRTVQEFFTLLQNTLEANNLMTRPEMVYNMDESGLPLNTRVSKVISEKGNRDVVAITNKERGVVPIPKMETPPKRVRITQKAVVLTTPEYEETIRSRSAKQSSSRVRLFHGGKNAEQNTERSEVLKNTEAPTKESCLCGFCGVDYYSEKAKNMGPWIQCSDCKVWYHENCVGMSSKKITFICGKCVSLKD